jgi:hypothetical protein
MSWMSRVEGSQRLSRFLRKWRATVDEGESAAESQDPEGAVAVIAVHGVADQVAGKVAQQIAALLIGRQASGALYSEGKAEGIMLPVQGLEALNGVRSPERDSVFQYIEDNGNGSFTLRLVQGPTVSAARKSIRQSARSDFQRDEWIATHESHDLPKVPDNFERVRATHQQHADPGLAFTDYLLFKAERNKTKHEAYETTRIRMKRQTGAAEPALAIDVYEMYWADLSRLSGNVPRIVAEAFTLLFRFSRLGRETVDEASRAARKRLLRLKPELERAQAEARRAAANKGTANKGEAIIARQRVRNLKRQIREEHAWPRLATAQIALDWALSSLLAHMLLHLAVCGTLIAVLSAASRNTTTIAAVLTTLLAGAALWWTSYGVEALPARLLSYAGVAMATWLVVQLVPDSVKVGLVLLGTTVLLVDLGLRAAEARFPSTILFGRLFLCVSILGITGHVAVETFGSSTIGLRDWMAATLWMTEALLVLIVAWWAVVPFVMLTWLYYGWRVSARSAGARASVATGRLGLFVSTAVLLIVAIAFWALMTEVLRTSANDVVYCQWIFGERDCLKGGEYLRQRYANSTEMFALVLGLALTLTLSLVVMVVPSVLAELKLSVGTASNLGRWLTKGYRNLDALIGPLVLIAVGCGCGVGMLLLATRFDFVPPSWMEHVRQGFAHASAQILEPLVISAASLLAAFSALGGLISRYAPWMRLPLDVALDVDNYLREFPRTAIPRAKIFARYVALLDHLVSAGYTRIIIVAHSQGSVISADLLRYLKHCSQQPRGALRVLGERLNGRIDLVTAGCPLRQLYAARFPELYSWVTQSHGSEICGPLPAELGLRSWTNFYTSGDYVGRWLWCDGPPQSDRRGGQEIAYDSDAEAPTPSEGSTGDWCLGFGAHTHYFDQDQTRLRSFLDRVVEREAAARSDAERDTRPTILQSGTC